MGSLKLSNAMRGQYIGLVNGAQVTLPAMCRGVDLTHHAASVYPAVMGTSCKKRNLENCEWH